MDIRTQNEEYSNIAGELINSEPALEYIRDSEVTIVYLSSEHEKKKNGKIVFGECEKIQDKYKWAIPADFTITLYEPNIEDFTPEQIKILLFHELLHVGIRVSDSGYDDFYVKPHDIEEFKLIADRFGIGWADDDNDFEIGM